MQAVIPPISAAPLPTARWGLGKLSFNGSFGMAPTSFPKSPTVGRLRCFPTQPFVHLFDLEKILKYKKGAVAERQQELTKLRNLLLTLTTSEPRLNLSTLPDIPDKTTQLKILEDQLDALVCAYVCAYWWYWGEAKNQVLGNEQEGYIVVPHRRCCPGA
jgi:predicted RNase H-like nuclease